MRWSRLVVAVGVVAGAAFAVTDEADNLLAHCEAHSQDWYARVLLLAVLFVLHSTVLTAAGYAVLKLSLASKQLLKRLAEIGIAAAIALAVGFLMAIADPVMYYALSVLCAFMDACHQPGFAESLLRGSSVAAAWPNTPVATFMVTLFFTGALVAQEVVLREAPSSAQRSVA
jgi:hypothetical protein